MTTTEATAMAGVEIRLIHPIRPMILLRFKTESSCILFL